MFVVQIPIPGIADMPRAREWKDRIDGMILNYAEVQAKREQIRIVRQSRGHYAIRIWVSTAERLVQVTQNLYAEGFLD